MIMASLSMKSVYSDIIKTRQKNPLLCRSNLLRKMNKIILFISWKLFPKMGVCLEKILAELRLVTLNGILNGHLHCELMIFY